MNQLLLFQDDDEVILKRRVENVELKYDNLRKSQHARISMLQKDIKELKLKLEFMESHICKNSLFI